MSAFDSAAARGNSLSVAILGAGGTVAPAIVRDLAESPEANELVLLDVALAKAQATADKFGGGKAIAMEVDARHPRGMANAPDDIDVLVNAADHRINLDAMRACLEVGSCYIDLGGLYWTTQQQLGLDQAFRDAGLLALLGMGSAPGKTNVMAAVATAALGGIAERIDVTAGACDLESPNGFAPPYAVEALIDELTQKPIVLRSGEPIEIEPRTEAGIVDFPEPIGEAPAIFTLHSELLTFGSSFGCSECSFRLSLDPEMLAQLVEFAETGEDERRAVVDAARPSSNTVSVHMVDAYYGDRHARVACKTSPVERWGMGGSVVSTAAPAAAAVRLLARGQLHSTGALPPEACVDGAELFVELEGRGAEFSVTESFGRA
ncbi:MAG: saccharopine dehydrogenase NADP-binding domain-containing protein [Solirubrobacterales bacterium]